VSILSIIGSVLADGFIGRYKWVGKNNSIKFLNC
jgi:hypothetical protein